MHNTSKLGALLNDGRFVVTAEVGPPKGTSVNAFCKTIKAMMPHISAINVTDNPAAVVRLSSFAGSLHVLREGGEPVMHVTCRDRNRIGLQSDLLGAYSLGIRNLLVLTGDSPAIGNHPNAKPVFDLDSVELCATVSRMAKEGRFMNGERMKTPPRFLIGCGENPFADLKRPCIDRLRAKVDAGAHFVQTQPVFDIERFGAWMKAVFESDIKHRVHILAGILPVRSLNALERISRIPGIHIPDKVYDRFCGLSPKEQASEGIRLSIETAQQLKQIPGVSGLHIMAVGWHASVNTISSALATDAGHTPDSRAAL